MVRAVLVVSRYRNRPIKLDAYRDALNRALAGDNIEPRAPRLARQPGVAAALLNPNGATRMTGTSIAIGTLLDAADDWHVPAAALPDGSFALLRVDDAYVELVADSAGSRTLWYVLTDQELIASSSQRAIVMLLGSFQPNRTALPWMLSSGTLGPTAAWDARVQRLQPGERVLLNRQQWRLTTRTEPLQFTPDDSSPRSAHRERLHECVGEACRRWSFDARRWVLTLSGGIDSRSLLYLFRERGIGTVTWGLPHSAEQDDNDAHVAQRLARILAVPHRFFPMETPRDALESVLERFLTVGEGRVARISGYVDGFRIWKTLFDEGCQGVIRGDEAFGSVPVSSPDAARWTVGLTTLADYFPAAELARFELPPQPLPAPLERRRHETLATWRDRLYQQFRVPTLLAGLTDLKTAYVEVCNPLLANSVLACVRTLPDHLRTEKRLWHEIVSRQLPSFGLATRVAIPALTDFLADPRVLRLLLEDLSSETAASVFSPLLRARCLSALRAALRETPHPHAAEQCGPGIARAVPAKLRAVIRHWSRPTLEPLVVAFRASIATRMHRLLSRDAAVAPAGLRRAVNL